jgi:outer membrane protein OmpA-like peptidoglycan-associated protein
MVTLLLGFFVIFFNVKNDPLNIQILLDKFKNHLKTTDSPREQQSQKDVSLALFHPLTQDAEVLPLQIGNKLIIEFPGISFFEAGAIDLTDAGKKALATFAGKAKDFTGQFRYVVRGYTDNKAPGKHPIYKDNLELSAFRSISAIRYLKDQGLKLADMRIGGYGETEHSERRLPAEVRKSDRKIVIVIEPLDNTERVLNQTMENESIKFRTLCQMQTQEKITCNSMSELLPSEFQWLPTRFKTRTTASFIKEKELRLLENKNSEPKKSDWIHDNFLYKFLNDTKDTGDDQ